VFRKAVLAIAIGASVFLPLGAQAQERTVESAQRFLAQKLYGLKVNARPGVFAPAPINAVAFGPDQKFFPNTPGHCLMGMVTYSYLATIDLTNADVSSGITTIIVMRGATLFGGGLANLTPFTAINQANLEIEMVSLSDKDRIQAAFDFLRNECEKNDTGF
jgi:hypothetical protein